MKLRWFAVGLAGALACLAGCSTERGANGDEYYSGSSSGVKPSPTMRPGMDPQDIRDPNYLNHPHPSSPTTP